MWPSRLLSGLFRLGSMIGRILFKQDAKVNAAREGKFLGQPKENKVREQATKSC